MIPKKGRQALRSGRVSIPGHYYFLTFNTHQRNPVFQEFEIACWFSKYLNSPEAILDSELLAWVIMPDHIHILIKLGSQQSLGALIQRLKSNSTRQIQYSQKLWDSRFYDQMIRDDRHLKNTARYIVANPLRAKLVDKLADYPFWNAVWL